MVVTGNIWLFVYASTPGAAPHEASDWPASSQLELASDRATLVMFAHPKCACTRASLAELARLMARLGSRVRAYVVFMRPTGVDDDWTHTDLVERARAIDGVIAIADTENGESERFGAMTSGTTMLYTADGSLRFSGGVTAARGHEGASVGQQRILDIIESGHTDRQDAAVFGCALDDSPTLTARAGGP